MSNSELHVIKLIIYFVSQVGSVSESASDPIIMCGMYFNCFWCCRLLIIITKEKKIKKRKAIGSKLSQLFSFLKNLKQIKKRDGSVVDFILRQYGCGVAAWKLLHTVAYQLSLCEIKRMRAKFYL